MNAPDIFDFAIDVDMFDGDAFLSCPARRCAWGIGLARAGGSLGALFMVAADHIASAHGAPEHTP